MLLQGGDESRPSALAVHHRDRQARLLPRGFCRFGKGESLAVQLQAQAGEVPQQRHRTRPQSHSEEVACGAMLRSFHSAERAIEGIEALHMMRKGQVKRFGRKRLGGAGTVRREPLRGRRLIEKFKTPSCASKNCLQHNQARHHRPRRAAAPCNPPSPIAAPGPAPVNCSCLPYSPHHHC